MIYSSFRDWVVAEVIPLQKKNPNWIRLDGELNGGNRNVVGQFTHAGRVWVVHGDTRFDPVLRAYNAILNGSAKDPFVVKKARVRDCLDLVPKLVIKGQPKHFYFYA
jgi:hypothetical protein